MVLLVEEGGREGVELKITKMASGLLFWKGQKKMEDIVIYTKG